jgi:hypothetical protein
MVERKKRFEMISPSGPTSISTVTALRETPGRRLHTSFESRGGSIGSTSPGR